MKRFVVSSLTAVCGLLVTTTAHASFVEKSFQQSPEWKTQEQVDAEKDVRLDARTAVPNSDVIEEQTDERSNDFNGTEHEGSSKEFGSKLTEVKITAGAPVTRAQFTAMFVRTNYTQASIDSCYSDITSVWPPRFELLFRDVPVDHPYAPEVCVAMREGLVRGYGNDVFRPDATVSFADAAKIVARAEGLTPWADPSTPKHWFDPYVNALARRNAIPMSVEAIDERLTGAQAQDIITRLATDDRTQASRTSDELISAWEKKYEAPKKAPVMVIKLPVKKPTASAGSSSSAKAVPAPSSAPAAPSAPVAKPKSSAAPIIPTGGSSSKPKAWYEF